MRTLHSPDPVKPAKGLPLLWHGLGSLITAIPAGVLMTLVWNVLLAFFPWKAPENDFALAWQSVLALLPMLFAPGWCLAGIVRGFRYKGAKGNMACVIMSAFGLMAALIVCVVLYMIMTGQIVPAAE